MAGADGAPRRRHRKKAEGAAPAYAGAALPGLDQLASAGPGPSAGPAPGAGSGSDPGPSAPGTAAGTGPGAPAPDAAPAPAPGPEALELEVKPKRSHHRRRDPAAPAPEAPALDAHEFAMGITALLETAAVSALGTNEASMEPAERALIGRSLERMIQRATPEVAQRVQAYTDPVCLLGGLGMWLLRVRSLRADRRRAEVQQEAARQHSAGPVRGDDGASGPPIPAPPGNGRAYGLDPLEERAPALGAVADDLGLGSLGDTAIDPGDLGGV